MAASTTKSSPADSPPQIPHYPYFYASRRQVLSRSVKIILSHGSSKEEVKQAVNRSLDDIFAKSLPLPVKLVQQRRSWAADTLTFSLIAKMGPLGLMSTPITGTVHVTDHELTIDVNLGLLERLIPADKACEVLTTRFKGLLK
jgi:hypothetical protein